MINEQHLALGGAALAIAWKVGHTTRELQARSVCLGAAQSALSEFYQLAERLLKDPATPDQLKDVVYDMTLAVTRDETGKICFQTVMEFLQKDSSHKGGTSGLRTHLDQLRRHRSDLAEDFATAMRSAIAYLLFWHGPDHDKVVVEYEATRNQSVMLAITGSLVAAIKRMTSDGYSTASGGTAAAA